MTLDVRSLWDWCQDLIGRGRLSGGGPLGTPSLDLEETSPEVDGDEGRAVSGGGMVGPDEREAWHKSPRSP